MLKGKYFRWNLEKNVELQQQRGIGFQMVVRAINEDKVLEVSLHPNQEKYPSQQIVIIELNNYVYLVPFVQDGNEVFLKTIIPNRKMKKKYLGG